MSRIKTWFANRRENKDKIKYLDDSIHSKVVAQVDSNDIPRRSLQDSLHHETSKANEQSLSSNNNERTYSE